MEFSIDELKEASGAAIVRGVTVPGTFSICTDTRKIKGGEIFLPLSGANFDGHDFIETALANGAAGYFRSKKKFLYKDAKVILHVKDTLEAYLKIAAAYKEKINPITVAITGSSGKTTTKEMMASVLCEKFKIHKSCLNHNNEIGLCETMLTMPQCTEVLIVEMGMRGLGEIKLLSDYAKPDLAVIVNSGTSHIGRLGSVENIAKAKCEITSGLHKEGLLIAQDNDLIKQANTFGGNCIFIGPESPELKVLALNKNGSDFVYKGHEFHLNVEGEYNIQNALFVIEAGTKLGMKAEEIASGLNKYKSISQRWEVEKIHGFDVINDSYNANPDSVKASLKTFLELYDGQKVVVLGDMGELGEREVFYHEEIGRFLSNYSGVRLITVGSLAKYIAETAKIDSVSFEKNEEAAKYIFENIEEGTTILFKASRFMKFEQIIEELKRQ